MKPEIEALIANTASLPSLPSVAVEVVRLANSENANCQMVADALAADPALAAKVLKYVNSPIYATQHVVEDLRQAVVVMGLDASISLALSFTLVGTLSAESGGGLDYTHYWRRSLLAALSARELGAQLGEVALEELFLAALLQDVGMLVLDKLDSGFYAELDGCQYDHTALAAYEEGRAGVDHAAVGAHLLERWNLHFRTSMAVAVSHDPLSAPDSAGLTRFLRCVALSGLLADKLMNGDSLAEAYDCVQLAEAYLNVDALTLDAVLHRVRDAVPETEALFDISLLSAVEPRELMENAREVLMQRNLDAMRTVETLRESADVLEDRARELEWRSQRDTLTGTCNRGYLEHCLKDAFTRSQSSRRPISIVFADLDRFKDINDSYGHAVGDQVLRAAASILQENVRTGDVVGRYGGEEFLVVLPGLGAEKAQEVCERIVESVNARTHHLTGGGSVRVTISLGVVTHGEDLLFDNVEELLRAADTALYNAKRWGRNRVVNFRCGDSYHSPRSLH